MKKFLITFIGLCMSAGLFAQNLSFQVVAGYNHASVTEYDPISSVHVGAIVELGLSDNLFANLGVLYTGKGFTWKEGDAEMDADASYLQVPIHIGYRLPLTGELNLLAEVGPYVSYGLNGEATASAYGVNVGVDTFGDDGVLKNLDFGFGGKVSAEYGHYVLGVGYDMGLTNIAKDPEDDDSYKNSCLYVSFGYKF